MSPTVDPTFVVRIAGLPLAALDRLDGGHAAELVEEALDLEQWLVRQGAVLSDGLHEVIGQTGDTALRRRLIALRRAVFQAREPKDIPYEELPGGLAGDLKRWHERFRRRAELLRTVEAGLPRDASRRRRALHELAAAPALRDGLVLASRDLLFSLDRADPGRADRKLERKLAKYVSRLAGKTSPYSTFTSTTQGRWVDTGTVADRPRYVVGAQRVSVVELNAFTQQQIPRTLSGWPEIRPHLTLSVNSSVVEDERAIRFLGRRDGEAVIELARTPTLRRFLHQIRHGADRTHGGVVRALAGLERADRSEEIAGFLDKLVDVGLVEIGFGIADDETDQLGALVRALEDFTGERVERVRSTVAALRDDLAGYASGEGGRLDRSAGITRRLTDLYGQLGWDATGDNFPKNVFYEDVLVAGPGSDVPVRPWRELLGELDLVRHLAGLYDRFLPGRIAAEAFFTRHHGPGEQVPFLDFYRAFCRELGTPAGADLATCYERAFPVPRVGPARLDTLAGLQAELAGAVAALPADDAGVRHLDGAWLRDFAARLPAFVRPIESMACYVQPMAAPDGGVTAVLNELMTGHGRSRARLLRLDRMAGLGTFDLPDPARRPGHVAEITGTVGSNLNLTHPVSRDEISYPLSTSGRPEENRLALADLQVVHDPAAGELRLVSKDHGTTVTPVHTGVMVEFLLPPAYRFLIQMFGQAVPRFEFVKHLATASPTAEHDGVRRHPRLVLGSLVVNRATWAAPAAVLPRRGTLSAVEYLLEVNRWRRRHGLPRRCFVRAMAGRGTPSQRSRVDGLFDKTRKPVYVDFGSPLLLDVLDEVVTGTDQLLVFEEMLPGRGEAVVEQDGELRAAEFVIELGGKP
ncbi:lantibiotic dehydratase [Amycolatopsis suaedae]|uniref:lantibiotic dehydratase n=1 Tax=Amycolatopsis suaedae TaxID=2510978 RepID=UPI0013EF1DDC|nr:lantibiotic dehydratase [Amycolatopsis suaedae]